jgi:hypothetical protein
VTLLDALPPDARSRRKDPDDEPWGVTEELLAQLVEMTSVVAAERRLKEPILLPRPGLPDRGKRAAGKPGANTVVGLGPATAAMLAWAKANGPERFKNPQPRMVLEGGEPGG